MSSIISFILVGLLVMFTNVAALGPAPVNLGAAAGFVVLTTSAISVVPTSTITGNIGLSPEPATFLTGFSLVLDSSGTFATSSQVIGQIFAADYTSPTPSTLIAANSAVITAYADAVSRSPDFLNLNNGFLGGETLPPGVYSFGGAVTVGTDVFIAGSADDTWIFQIAGTLNLDSATNVVLTGGALSSNIVWAVAGPATLGTTAHIEGVLITQADATLLTGATINGRVFAERSVTLQMNIINPPS